MIHSFSLIKEEHQGKSTRINRSMDINQTARRQKEVSQAKVFFGM
jgi:hypothetical protein